MVRVVALERASLTVLIANEYALAAYPSARQCRRAIENAMKLASRATRIAGPGRREATRRLNPQARHVALQGQGQRQDGGRRRTYAAS